MPADRDTHHGVYRHSFAKEVLGQRFASSSSSAPARLSTSASEENRGVMTFTTGDCEVQMVALLEASKTGHGYAPAGECSRPPKSTNQSRCNEVQKYLMILGDYARVAKECITTNTSECKFCDPYSCKGPKVWEEAKIGCPSEIARHLRIHLCARHQPFHCMFPNCGKAKTQKTNMTSHFGVQ
ncbi:hypothetical protein BDW22DRAFT_616297 [Trametopsis cervina]|nr:hypothetical protein BDW22DRAFT_616297 [Trametopsis cervina]